MKLAKHTLLIVLAFCLTVFAVACEKEQPHSFDMSGITVKPGMVIVSHPTADSVVMEVADQTTLQGFGNSVVANEGYRIAVLFGDGSEVTDQDTLLVNGMTFALYEADKTEPKLTAPIQIVDPIKVRRHYANVAQ